jgi:DNA repair exonuclease SbcCD ATPase subunit
LIKDILKSDDNYRKIFLRLNSHISQFETDIHAKVTKLFEIESKLIDLKKDQKDLGSQDAIKEQLNSLNNEYNKFHGTGEVSEQERELQEELRKELEDLNSKLSSCEKDELLLSEFLDYLKDEKNFLNKDIIQDLSGKTKSDIYSGIFVADVIYKESLAVFIGEKLDLKKDIIENIKETIKSKDTEFETLNTKLNSSDQAKTIFERIQSENHKLSLIKSKKEEVNKTEEDYEKMLKEIFSTYNSFITNLELEKKSFSFDSDKYSNFKVELLFKTEKFKKCLKKSLNRKRFSTFEKEENINLDEFSYDHDNFQKELKTIIEAILNDSLITKSGKNKKEVIQELLGVYHFINFNIVEDGDKLEKMSPGKRSFALLKVLIESDNSKWPILIDQPEDDLDANSISKYLSKFLKEKKKYRQIIIVSHNPNLVVGADSEQVIVANQHGSDSKNKSKKFEYISGSIENTYENKNEKCYLYCKGIKDHICDILEGGEESFKKRQYKYNIE